MATPKRKPSTKATAKAGSKSSGGRPPKYDRTKLVPKICERLASGEPMTVVCRELKVPVRTVNDWRLADEDIRQQFDEARDLGYDAIAADCLAIADTPQLGVIEKIELVTPKKGRAKMVVTERRNEDMLGHRKLQVETRLKLLARWDPRRYGEKVQLADNEGGKLPAHQMTDAQLLAVIEAQTKPKESDHG